MKKFRNENEMRNALEKDYPVPERLSPENIQTMLMSSKKAQAKRSNITIIKRITAAAAAVAILAAGTLTALHLKDRPSASIPKSSDPSVETVISDNEPASISNVYSKKSYSSIYKALMKQKDLYNTDKGYTNGAIIEEDFTDAEGSLAGTGSAPTRPEASDDYYKTYLQTEGVDEADQIKTDGRFIYYATSDYIYVVDPNHGAPSVSDKIKLEEEYYYWTSPQLYLADGKLITMYAEDYNSTTVNVYNVTDSGTLESHITYTQSGSYTDSRMIGGQLYLITESYVDYYSIERNDPESYIPTYELNDDTCLVKAEDIYISHCCPGYCYTTVSSFDVNNGSEGITVKSTLGGRATVYCSSENLYLMRGYYDDKSYTEITKIALNGGELKMSSAASVEGYVKDQFSADEYGGYFRIAVTRAEDNAVYILGNDLDIVGSVGGMGIDETIKSVSFSGYTAYVVTFRQTDPLYTIDLSDPKNPVVTDALKVSGFSTHLRSFGDGLLLGFGQEADIETGGTTGIKLSMFKQNSDGENDEIAKIVYGDEFTYTYSAATWDHKYLMILPDKGLIGFPLYEDSWTSSYYDYGYDEYICHYYYVICRYTDNGFEEFARIDLNTNSNYECRAIYIGDVIYVFSDNEIISVDMNSGESISKKSLG